MHDKEKTTAALLSPPKRDRDKHGHSKMDRGGGSRHIWVGQKGAGLNFTGFADGRRKGGGNAMGEGGGSGERERGILTFTYRRQAEQSRGRQSKHYEEIWPFFFLLFCSVRLSPSRER